MLRLHLDTSTDGPFCALMSATYAYSAAHQFMSSLTSIVGTDQRITAPTVTTGTFDGADLTYTSVSGNQVTEFAIYRKNSQARIPRGVLSFSSIPVLPACR